MANHYHMLVETIEPTLSRGMKKIGGDYATWFNKRHHRVGHLFQSRFKAHLIDSEEYLLTVARYIVLNPVRAHIVSDALEWPWSSARATAGCAIVPPWLTTETILTHLHPQELSSAQQLYRAFIFDAGAAKSPWRQLVGQTYLGGRTFIDCVQKRIDERKRSEEHPRAQRLARCVTAAEIHDAVASLHPSPQRRLAYATLAHTEALLPLREIGEALGIGASGAWRMIQRAQLLEKSDGEFAGMLDRLRLTIKKSKIKT